MASFEQKEKNFVVIICNFSRDLFPISGMPDRKGRMMF